jgi:phospholipase C
MIYFDPIDIIPLSLLIHFPRLLKYTPTNFDFYDSFKKDVRDGTLPKYSFIEPRLFIKHNDEHPPDSLFGNFFTPSNVLAGEILINDVYNAIRTSNSTTGNNWKNTLLVITYDEHGGTYDHVQPPSAIPPYANAPAGEMDFTFNRAGRRVPAVLISAYIDSNTVYNDTLRHTSMIKTLSMKFSLPNLTFRDLTSPDLLGVFNRSTIRDVNTWPIPKPRALPNDADKEFYLSLPLTEFQEDLIGVAAALEKMSTPLGIKTTKDAINYLKGFKQRMNIKFKGDL